MYQIVPTDLNKILLLLLLLLLLKKKKNKDNVADSRT